MRSALARLAVLAAALVLAGCADAPRHATAPVTAEPVAFREVAATPTTGVVKGFVVDEAIRPLAAVRVSLQGVAGQRLTAADGAFAFGALAPGDYRLDAAAQGYLPAQVTVSVVAGVADPRLVDVVLRADPVLRPYVDLLKWSGFMECGVGTNGGGEAGRALLPCAAAQSTGLVHSDTVHDFAFNGGLPDFAQAELVWSSTQALGDDLKMDFPALGVNVGGNGSWASVGGPSPLALPVPGSAISGNLGPDATRIEVRVLPGEQGPLVLDVEQGFDAYMAYFHHFTPRAGWTLVADGPCGSPADCG